MRKLYYQLSENSPKILWLAILGILFLGKLNLNYAQSFFSMKGFGEEVLCNDVKAISLGRLVNISQENPAYPLILNKTEFHASIASNFVFAQEANYQRLIYHIRPTLVRFNFPLPARFNVGIKLSEYFNQNFDIYSESIPVANYWTRRRIIGKGGINGLGVCLGNRLFADKLSLGMAYNKLLGEELEIWNFEVFQGSYQTSDTVRISYSTHQLKLGMLLDISGISVGVTLEEFLTGAINQKVISHNSIVDTIHGVRFNLPKSYGLGCGVNIIPNLKLFSDFFVRQWQKATINDTFFNHFNSSMQVSIGGEYYIQENLPIRIGLRYYQSYLQDRTNNKITEFGLSGGSHIKIANFGGFNYAVEIVQRQSQFIKEWIARINFGLAYEEAWRKRTRRWGY
ncbi:MAG: hypothetical protein ABIK31_03380 [candidate division WOR-3 bacterium]